MGEPCLMWLWCDLVVSTTCEAKLESSARRPSQSEMRTTSSSCVNMWGKKSLRSAGPEGCCCWGNSFKKKANHWWFYGLFWNWIMPWVDQRTRLTNIITVCLDWIQKGRKCIEVTCRMVALLVFAQAPGFGDQRKAMLQDLVWEPSLNSRLPSKSLILQGCPSNHHGWYPIIWRCTW